MESQSRCLSLSLTPAEAELLRGVLRFFKGLSENLLDETINRRGEMEGLLVKLGGAAGGKSLPAPLIRKANREEASVPGAKGFYFAREELLAIL
ncbi:MAG: hypothetical protein HY892_11510 [Deltaproteobacteria bacterium]|nr:hypothetical protein [Deltaproteobacteria bacterium]